MAVGTAWALDARRRFFIAAIPDAKKYRVNRTLWRWTENTHPNAPAESNSHVETFHPGKIIDWLPANSVYIQLGWVSPI